jgi:hypothetical protein
MIKGYSFIWGIRDTVKTFYLGKYVKGYWWDNNDYIEHPKPRNQGFGIKIDIGIGKIIRPIPYFWKLDFWKKDKLWVQDILDKGEGYSREFFGDVLYERMMTLPSYHWVKRTIWNPWYAKYAFVLRTFSFLWPSISIGTPLLSFHIGSKAAQIDPFTRDITWCEENERQLALKEEPKDQFNILALSYTLRNTRD